MDRCDRAVSSVVSAVLIFALFSSAFVLWTAMTLPEWVADRESLHQDEVRGGLGSLQSGLERLSAADEQGPITASFPLGAPKVPLVQSAASSGELAYRDGFRFDAAFGDAHLHERDGAGQGTPDAPAGGQPVDGIATLTSLRLHIDSTVGGTADSNAESYVEARIGDDDEQVKVRVVHLGARRSGACDGAELAVRLGGDAAPSHRTLLCGVGSSLTRTVDLMDPDLGVKGALSGLDGPLSLRVVTGTAGAGGPTVQGAYAATWIDEDGRLRVAGSGQARAGHTLGAAGGHLAFTTQNREFVDQTLSWQGGAVVVAQDGGMAVGRSPSFSLQVDGTTGFVDWTVVQLRGDGAVSGTGTAQARVVHEDTRTSLLTTDTATLTIEGPHAAAWRAFLEDQVMAADATDASVGGSSDQAVLELAQGDVQDWVVRLRVIEARVDVS